MTDSIDENPRDIHRTLEQFNGIQQVGDTWRCLRCGREARQRSVVKHCHPADQLSRARESGVTAEDDTHQGFAYPKQLHADVRDFFATVENAIQHSEATPLRAASEVIAAQSPGSHFSSPALQLFAYLIFLQQHQVLPGYPRISTQSKEDLLSIKRFCANSEQFPGDVTSEAISESNVIASEDIYRAKVLTTTDEFQAKSKILPDSLWTWTTTRNARDESVRTDVIFGEGTAHNTVTATARLWLATHSDINWTCAPHVIPSTVGKQHHISPADKDMSPPSAEPVMMFDFAGFRNQNMQQLAVVGFVIDSESHLKIAEQLTRGAQPEAHTLVVFPKRKSITEFIGFAGSQGVFHGDLAPTDDIKEHYSSRPSIQAINTELEHRASNIQGGITFLSWKQLIDGIIEPEEVLPDQLPPKDA